MQGIQCRIEGQLDHTDQYLHNGQKSLVGYGPQSDRTHSNLQSAFYIQEENK